MHSIPLFITFAMFSIPSDLHHLYLCDPNITRIKYTMVVKSNFRNNMPNVYNTYKMKMVD